MTVDRVLGLGAVLLAIPVAVASWGFGVGSPKSPGAGFWPLLIAMAGLAISLILHPSQAVPSAATQDARWGRLWIALGTMAVYVVTLDPLGFPVATTILLFVQLRWVESRTWRSSAWIAALTALIAFVLFRVLLKVPLPAGVIPVPWGW
jgi:putative tricarboxylic transport membrane protein